MLMIVHYGSPSFSSSYYYCYYRNDPPGRRTVPNVFVGGKTIGGGDDTKALSDAGKLSKLLKEAGAL